MEKSQHNLSLVQEHFTISNEELQQLFSRLEEDYRKSFQVRELLYNLHHTKNVEKAERLKECGKYITKYDSILGSALLMNKCHIRLCPVCEKQSAMQRFISLVDILQHNETKGGLFHFIFTCKNCEGRYLRDTIQGISAGVRMFMRHFNVKNYTRRIEVTYNKKSNTYHPHAHCIVMVEKGVLYFKDISHETFIDNLRSIRMYWRDCCIKHNINVGNLDYQEVYARPLSDKRELIECVKYSVKPMSITSESIETINEATKGLKLFNGSGIFRKLSTSEENKEHHKLIIDSAQVQSTYCRTYKQGYKQISYRDVNEVEKMKANLKL